MAWRCWWAAARWRWRCAESEARKQNPARLRGRGCGQSDDRSGGGQATTDSTHSTSLLLGNAPILVAATWPPLKSIRVGMPWMPYFLAVFGLWSTLSFAMVTFSAMFVPISSRVGAICLHGPHHSAQKSTSTGLLDLSTSVSKLASDVVVVMVTPGLGNARGYGHGGLPRIYGPGGGPSRRVTVQ